MGLTLIQRSEGRKLPAHPKIGLVLAGGAVTGGAFKVGGLKALDEFLVSHKVTEFDIYVGLSAGAFLATSLSGGITPDEMIEALDGTSEKLDQLRSIAGAVASDATQAPNELWIDFDDGLALADEQAILDLLGDPDRSPLLISNPRHRAGMLAELAADPILQASGSGILLFAMAGVMSVAMLGFAVTLGLTLRERIVEFSVLRALGLSRFGILRAMLLEWGVVLLLGAAVGVLLGRQIARLMLRFLEVTEDGERVVPGFSLAFDLGLLGGGLATLGVVAAIALLGSWRLALRRANASALRLTP